MGVPVPGADTVTCAVRVTAWPKTELVVDTPLVVVVALATTVSTAGETVFCYVHDAATLIDDLAARSDLRYVHRPANLEDVFLRLTGRDLRD